MIKITNGLTVIEVTNGAYKSIYSKQGFAPVEEKKVSGAPEATAESEESPDDKLADELSTKPISQWDKDEVKKFAAIKGIDISGTKNASEAREVIKEFLAEQA